MNRTFRSFVERLGLVFLMLVASVSKSTAEAPLVFEGACGASAAVLSSPGRVWVGTDDDNVLRAYDPRRGGAPLAHFDLYSLLGIDRRAVRHSAHIEAVTRVDGHTLWVTSHGRNRFGQNRPNRRSLFMLDLSGDPNTATFRPVGRVYTDLLTQLSEAPALRRMGLANWIRLPYRRIESLAPDRHGFSLGGLAPTREGRGIWLAARGPVLGRQAVLIPLANPAAVLLEDATPAFGEPLKMSLDRLGVRALEATPERDRYLIAAGPRDDAGPFALFEWSGKRVEAPRRLSVALPGDFRVEALALQNGRVLALSDDSRRERAVATDTDCRVPRVEGGCPCESLTKSKDKRFRGQWIPWPAPEPSTSPLEADRDQGVGAP